MVSVCQALAGQCADSLVMTSPGGWLELEEAPIFTKDGRRFTMALSANGYKQVWIRITFLGSISTIFR